MKSVINTIWCILLAVSVQAQTESLFQLNTKLKLLEEKENYKFDTVYLNTLIKISFIYADNYPDSALLRLPILERNCTSAGHEKGEVDVYNVYGNTYQTKGDFGKALKYYEKSYRLAQKIGYKKTLPGLLGNIALVYLNQGNYPVALERFFESLKEAESIGDKQVILSSHNNIGTIYFYQGKMNDAEIAYQKTLKIALEIKDTSSIALAYNNMGEVNLEQNNPSKALQNLSVAYELANLKNYSGILLAITNTLGDTYFRLDSTQKAYDFFQNALLLSEQRDNARATCKALIGLAKVHQRKGLKNEALNDAMRALQKAREMGQAQLLRDAYEIVADIYEDLGDGSSAFQYYRNFKIYDDSLQSLETERIVANYKAENEFSKKELEFERNALKQRWLMYAALAAMVTLVVIVWIVNRNRKWLRLTYKELQQKNVTIEGQKLQAEQTLSMLKATQSQLILSEKMASLGELTAGIAHEIQNPLNFVNNFSEVNRELISELVDEVEKGNIEEVKLLATDIKENSEKINHHGKRADAIVKGMLQHSRSTNNATKEPTDINALANEYLRLAYHGLRAKDKTFNATMKTDFDESIGNINIIPQDIGRVILNLITNAFCAVDEKKKQTGNDYEPTISVSTKKRNNEVVITVSDNGTGIPDAIREKIFQPFFTTKPTGSGTGLGLSLAYDIIKAQGGEVKAEKNATGGASFIIYLPVIN